MDKPVEQSCFWLSTRSASRPAVRLQAKSEADVTVVGAGFTGLWTAYFLKSLEPSLEIAIVEQGCTGYGGSGRNAGMISACIDHSHALAINHFGEMEAGRLSRIGLRNIEELCAFAIDCDVERTGQLHVALAESHVAECRKLSRRPSDWDWTAIDFWTLMAPGAS